MMSQLTGFIWRYCFILLLFLVLGKFAAISVHAQTLTSFTFDDFTSGGNKKAGVPFVVKITAKDGSSNTLTSFSGAVQVTDSTGTIFPITTTNFTDGVWQGSFYITEATSTAITVSYSGVQNSSSSFTVDPDSRIKFLTITSGNNQTATVNTQLTNALAVAVVDPYNNPIPNQGVNFAINSYPPNATGQSLGSSSATSNSSGAASTVMTLGRKSGTYIVRANLASGVTTPVEFYETATPSILLSLSVTPQVAVMPAGTYIAFTATGRDVYQNERTLSSVTWSVQNDGGTIDSTGVFHAGDTIGTYLNTVRAVSGGVGVKERYELHILLTNQGEARVIETRKSLRAELGITGGGVQTKSFRGWQFFAIEYKKVYGVTQIFPPRAGEAMNMQYNAASFRGPFLKLLSDNGWKIKPVTLSLKWGL